MTTLDLIATVVLALALSGAFVWGTVILRDWQERRRP